MNPERIASLNPTRVLDIGANVGGFFFDTKPLWPGAFYTLIEANERCKPRLESTGQRYYIATLGDSCREVNFYTVPSIPTCTGNSYYRELTDVYDDSNVLVEKKTLVPLSELLPGESFDFIKVDVQGAEMDVIRGGLDIFRSAEHVLMEVSVQEYNRGAPLWDDMMPFMASIGFVDHTVVNDLHHPAMGLIQHDVLFRRAPR